MRMMIMYLLIGAENLSLYAKERRDGEGRAEEFKIPIARRSADQSDLIAVHLNARQFIVLMMIVLGDDIRAGTILWA